MDEKPLTKEDVKEIVRELLFSYQHDMTVANISFFKGKKLRFLQRHAGYEIYQDAEDADEDGNLVIDATTDYDNEGIQIGKYKKPLFVYITGGDEAVLRADDNTNISYVLVTPDHIGMFTDAGNDFYFRLPNGNGNPSATITGALAVVSGKLKIYDGANWVVVGTQT